MSKLLVNLAFMGSQHTGLTTYGRNLFPHLLSLEPTLLSLLPQEGFNYYLVPEFLNPDSSRQANLLRLLWTQFRLPNLYQKLQANLLFSPIPEAPIYTNCRYIVTVHDLIPLRFPLGFSRLTQYYRYYLPTVLRQAEHVICDSVATAQDITHFFSLPEKKVTPIPLAYDAQHFYPLELAQQGITFCIWDAMIFIKTSQDYYNLSLDYQTIKITNFGWWGQQTDAILLNCNGKLKNYQLLGKLSFSTTLLINNYR